MARLRPFRGLRYTLAAGELAPLLAPPTAFLTPNEREGYAHRSAHNAVALAAPEGHGDDRSKYVRYARSAARMAEWTRAGVLGVEARPALYRLTQRFGSDPLVRTTLLAVADPNVGVEMARGSDARLRESRLRLMEATRTAFEPTLALYADPDGAKDALLRALPASSESRGSLDGVGAVLETIDDPEAIERAVAAFADTLLLAADGAEGLEASVAFGGGGAFVALTALDAPAFIRLAVHRVVRRLPEGRQATLARLAERFTVVEHHNRNLILHVDQASAEGRAAFGLATEGGLGYLLTPKETADGPANAWFYREVLGPVFGLGATDPGLAFTDPVQAVRAADEGAAAAVILPRPERSELTSAARTFPSIPTGLVFWSIGGDA